MKYTFMGEPYASFQIAVLCVQAITFLIPFILLKLIRNWILILSLFKVSFDIVSLFTNVTLEETIDICIDVLYHGHLCIPQFSENIFNACCCWWCRFSFNNVRYSQIVAIAVGIPLSPVFTNILVVFFLGWGGKLAVWKCS